jgi:ethanolamine utilization protein EutQ (cupin superfamily)
MVKLIKKEEGKIRIISENYQVNNFITKEISEKVSVAISEGNNYQKTTKNIESDRVYYVLEGKLIVNNDLIAEEGDFIFVPKGEEYTFSGTFKTILINSPAFGAKSEEIKELK